MNPKQKLEQAAVAYIEGLETPLTLIESTSVYGGIRNPQSVEHDENTGEPAQKSHPSLTLEADGSHEELVINTRIYQGMLAATVEAIAAETTADEFDEICEEAFSKFNIVELTTNFSSRSSGFTLVHARIADFGDAVNNGTNWQKTLRLACVYACADL